MNDYIYRVEGLHDCSVDYVHVSHLKYYHDRSLNTKVIMSHLLTSETGLFFQRLTEQVDSEKILGLDPLA